MVWNKQIDNYCYVVSSFQTNNNQKKFWAHERDSNPRPNEHRADALIPELQGLLGERGLLFRSYRLVNRILCLKQALTRHDLNVSFSLKHAEINKVF